MSHSYDMPDENDEFECFRCGESLRCPDDEQEELQLGIGEHFGCYMEAKD